MIPQILVQDLMNGALFLVRNRSRGRLMIRQSMEDWIPSRAGMTINIKSLV